MKKNNYRNNQKGQSIVVLLFFIMTAMTVTAAAAYIIGANSLSSSRHQVGEAARTGAEAGVEKALVELLRNPDYTGEVLEIGNVSASIGVTGSQLKTITSVGESSGSFKTIEVVVNYDNNVLIPVSWREVN